MSTETKILQARERAIAVVMGNSRFVSPIEELYYWSLLSKGWPDVEFYTDDYASATEYKAEFPELGPAYVFARGSVTLGYPDVKTMGRAGGVNGFWFRQLGVGKYKLDFAFVGRGEDGLVREMRGDKTIRLAIELDGHDFHEKTKEQAQHDKERDRTLLEAGWSTVRYTGSEVYRDADACVANFFDLIRSMTPRATMTEMKAFVAARGAPGSQ